MTRLHDISDATARVHGARTALRQRGREVTHAQLAARSRALAAGLATLGVARGTRVVVYLQNRMEVVELALACSRLGAIFVPANPLLKARQLRHIISDSGAATLVFSNSMNSVVSEALSAGVAPLCIVCDGDEAPTIAGRKAILYESLPGAAGSPPENPVIDRDPLAILYTSGSTGAPKGVVVSHRNVVSGAIEVSRYLQNSPDDRLLTALPLSFDYGLSQVTTALAVGACAVLTNYSTAAALVQEIALEKITGLAGVPTMWAHLVESEFAPTQLQSLRYATNSGGALSHALLRKLQQRLPGARIFSMYGLTEAFRSTYLDPAELERRPNSIGKAVANQEVMVLRPDGTPCAANEPGELVHRGSFVALGYWNDSERTHRRFRPLPAANHGLVDEIAVWSGDIARYDADGFLYFMGRNDQLIKTSGHRISATEIEDVLSEVPGVVEVVAVGLPDELLGQRVAVALVASPGATGALIDKVRQHARIHLPTFMVPTQLTVLAGIPRNANGKPDRSALANLLERGG